jgi:predicted ATPase
MHRRPTGDKTRPRRRRGVLLTDSGLSRILDRQRHLAEENDGSRISLEAFSASVGLSTRTLSRLLNRAAPVDYRTAEALFFALDLVLDESDYHHSATYLVYRTPTNRVPQPLTTLIGRDQVLDHLEKMIATSRLLTLTGIGGIGKTRLAIELALRREAKGDEQVWLFELAAVADPVESITNVAIALGIAIDASGTFTTVREQLVHEPGLLLLDGCEELAATLAPFVLNLLRACPSLRVLATSREPLALEGEQVFQVPPLAVPELTVAITASNAMQYPAIALFAERARSTNGSFVFDDEVAQVAAEIVKRLDGIPLGIELAAARAEEVFSPDFLLYLQEHRTNLVSGGDDPRHHSMSALMDWSFERLTDQERIMYRRASVFSGSFDATALAAICEDALSLESTTSVASQLVRKALLESDDQASPARYMFLDPVREYASARLAETDECARSRQLHAWYYLQVTRNVMRSFREANQGTALQFLTSDFANVRSALDWSFTAHSEHIGAVLVSELPEYWDARGQYREGEDWIRRALQIDDELKTNLTRARLYEGLGLLLYRQSRLEEAALASSLSLEQFEALGDEFALCRVRNVLGIIEFDAGDVESARERHLVNLKKGEMLGYPRITVAALTNLGRIELDIDSDARMALGHFQKSLELATEIGRQTLVANALGNTADAYAQLGNIFLAIEFSKRAMRVLRELDNDALYCMRAMQTAIYSVRATGYQNALSELELALEAILTDPYRTELCDQLDVIAELLNDAGEAERAIVMLTATAEQRVRAGVAADSASLRSHQNILDRVRRQMSTDAYEDVQTRAVGLSVEAAFRAALAP